MGKLAAGSDKIELLGRAEVQDEVGPVVERAETWKPGLAGSHEIKTRAHLLSDPRFARRVLRVSDLHFVHFPGLGRLRQDNPKVAVTVAVLLYKFPRLAGIVRYGGNPQYPIEIDRQHARGAARHLEVHLCGC